MKSSLLRKLVWTIVLFALWGAGLVLRREVYHQQTRTLQDKEVPFLMESALQFRMTRMVAEKGTLPERDEKVQVPEGVNMRETYSVGAEWIYSALAKVLPIPGSFATRVRWVSAGLFCLAIPFAAAWAGRKNHSIWVAIATGGILAISPAFAVRSSGLELSRENGAIPLFTLFLLAEYLFTRSEFRWKKWFWAVVASTSLASAQCVWDLTQYVTGLWVVWSLFRRCKDREELPDAKILLTILSLALVTVSWINPYLRAHQSFFSPVMALVLARCALAWLPQLKNRGAILLIPGICWLVLFGLGTMFVENYSHFGELVVAKIRYLNVKPDNPALLNYEQRIMWTPALNSSTWRLTKTYFPICFWLFGIAMLLLIRGVKHGKCRFPAEFFYAGFTLVVYVFFFRFHVFLILFLAVCIGQLFDPSHYGKRGILRWILPVSGLLIYLGMEFYLLLFFEPKSANSQLTEQQRLLLRVFGESNNPGMKANRWGLAGADYGFVAELMENLNSLPNVEKGPVLANFGISASILAKTEMPIVLHPKFETPGIRERVREFYEHLFLKSEKELRDWAVGFGARYYVHSNGNFSTLDPRNSPRYMVNALEPPEGASIYVLENEPHSSTWFRPVFSSARFVVYRIVTPEDEELALRYTRLAAIAYESGDMETARKRAMEALSFHWKFPQAQKLLRAVLSQPSP